MTDPRDHDGRNAHTKNRTRPSRLVSRRARARAVRMLIKANLATAITTAAVLAIPRG
jgi:4-hydroxybenzoate polyprenyltransferase